MNEQIVELNKYTDMSFNSQIIKKINKQIKKNEQINKDKDKYNKMGMDISDQLPNQ